MQLAAIVQMAAAKCSGCCRQAASSHVYRLHLLLVGNERPFSMPRQVDSMKTDYPIIIGGQNFG